MALRLFGRLFEQNNDEAGGSRRTPAEINAEGNRNRLSRMEEISRVADGRRARELVDTDGEQVVGRFQDGEFDDSAEARERAELEAADEAEQELRDRAAEAERLEQEEAAQRLQREGAAPEGEETPPREEPAEERVINGVRHYLVIVKGVEKWLTLKQLREHAATVDDAEETLQRAEEALRSASRAALDPQGKATVQPPPREEISEEELENVILSANMGEQEAVKKLATLIREGRAKPGVDASEVSRQVAQQIATQREVDLAEREQSDILGNEVLAPEFKRRLADVARVSPTMKIREAYRKAADGMRKDFAAMLPRPDPRRPNGRPNGGDRPPPKDLRKRTIVNHPQSAGRQPRREEDDREVPVGEVIDQIARSRGLDRAHRIRRS